MYYICPTSWLLFFLALFYDSSSTVSIQVGCPSHLPVGSLWACEWESQLSGEVLLDLWPSSSCWPSCLLCSWPPGFWHCPAPLVQEAHLGITNPSHSSWPAASHHWAFWEFWCSAHTCSPHRLENRSWSSCFPTEHGGLDAFLHFQCTYPGVFPSLSHLIPPSPMCLRSPAFSVLCGAALPFSQACKFYPSGRLAASPRAMWNLSPLIVISAFSSFGI